MVVLKEHVKLRASDVGNASVIGLFTVNEYVGAVGALRLGLFRLCVNGITNCTGSSNCLMLAFHDCSSPTARWILLTR